MSVLVLRGFGPLELRQQVLDFIRDQGGTVHDTVTYTEEMFDAYIEPYRRSSVNTLEPTIVQVHDYHGPKAQTQPVKGVKDSG